MPVAVWAARGNKGNIMDKDSTQVKKIQLIKYHTRGREWIARFEDGTFQPIGTDEAKKVLELAGDPAGEPGYQKVEYQIGGLVQMEFQAPRITGTRTVARHKWNYVYT